MTTVFNGKHRLPVIKIKHNSSNTRFVQLFLMTTFISVLVVRESMKLSYPKIQQPAPVIVRVQLKEGQPEKHGSGIDETVTSKACPSKQQKRIFDPFNDFTFRDLPSGEQNVMYSSHHCLGTGNRANPLQSDAQSYRKRRPNFVSRSCNYKNLYYCIRDQTFHYFPSPAEQHFWNHTVQANSHTANDTLTRIEVSIGPTSDAYSGKRLVHYRIEPWKPILHWTGSPPPNRNVYQLGPENIKMVLYRPFHSHNLGHFLWDDLMALFSLLHLFGYDKHTLLEDVLPVPLFVELARNDSNKPKQNHGGLDTQYSCQPWGPRKYVENQWGTKCTTRYKKQMHEFFGVKADPCTGDIARTGNWLLGEDAIGVWNGHPKEPVCAEAQGRSNEPPQNSEIQYVIVPEAMAGIGRLNYFGCEGECSIGRSPQWRAFRGFLFRQVFGPHRGCLEEQKEPKGYITFSLPGGSSRPDEVFWFEKEIKLAQQLYGNGTVQVVDMAKLTIQEQILLARDSVVLLTNHGGGGAVSTFLQSGSSVIVFWHGKVRKDHNFYESAGYFRTHWISVEERQYINRTMALIQNELEKTALVWPGILAAKL